MGELNKSEAVVVKPEDNSARHNSSVTSSVFSFSTYKMVAVSAVVILSTFGVLGAVLLRPLGWLSPEKPSFLTTTQFGPIHYTTAFDFEGDTNLENLIKDMSLLNDQMDNPPKGIDNLIARARRDEISIRQYLYQQGFIAASVEVYIDDFSLSSYNSERVDLRDVLEVKIVVNLGERFSLGRIDLEGAPPNFVLPAGFHEGSRASLSDLAILASRLILAWRDAGHPFAKITLRRIAVQNQRQLLSARFTVSPGTSALLGKIAVLGLTDGKHDEVIQTSGLSEGAPYRSRDIRRAERRLQDVWPQKNVLIREGSSLDENQKLPISIIFDDVTSTSNLSIRNDVSIRNSEIRTPLTNGLDRNFLFNDFSAGVVLPSLSWRYESEDLVLPMFVRTFKNYGAHDVTINWRFEGIFSEIYQRELSALLEALEDELDSNSKEPVSESDRPAGTLSPNWKTDIPIGSKISLGRPFLVQDAVTLVSEDGVVTLADVEGPSRDDVCLDKQDRAFACGLQARAAFTNLMRNSDNIACVVVQHDAPRAPNVRCALDDADFALSLAEAGWVRPRSGVVGSLSEAAERARSAARGMWNGNWRLRQVQSISPNVATPQNE